MRFVGNHMYPVKQPVFSFVSSSNICPPIVDDGIFETATVKIVKAKTKAWLISSVEKIM
jgi:hypothetical protein